MAWTVRAAEDGTYPRWLLEDDDGQGAIADTDRGTLFVMHVPAQALLAHGTWRNAKKGDQAAFEKAYVGLAIRP